MSERASRLRAYLRRIPSVLAVVLSNRALRAVVLAYAAFVALEWGTWVAMVVFAYTQGGATTAGIVAFVQLMPSLVFAPIAAVLGDRHRPGRVLALGYLALAVTTLAAAAALLADGSPLLVYALGTGVATASTLTRPVQSGLVPTIARTPLELTATNVALGWVESTTVLVAPAATGVLLTVSGPGLAFAVLGVAGLAAAALVLPVPGPPPSGETTGGAVREVFEGLGLLREREPRTLILLLGALFVGIGALDVLYAQLAIGALDAGSGWAGYLNAAFGAGGALGIVATVALVGRRHLTPPLAVGAVVWAVALVVLALVPTKATALVLLGVAGAAWVTVDVSGRTLLQRAAPGNLVARIFGLLEAVSAAGLALGSILVPVLVALGGSSAALVGAGAVLPLTLLVLGRHLRSIDAAADVPVVEIGLLRAMPLFAMLSPPTLESIARQLTQVHVPAGAAVVTEGDEGDRWYAVADGRLEVRRGGVVLTELGRADGFGEIALLRDVPRTATVTALTDSVVYALEKHAFLEAVTGHPRAVEEVDRVVADRLATHS